PDDGPGRADERGGPTPRRGEEANCRIRRLVGVAEAVSGERGRRGREEGDHVPPVVLQAVRQAEGVTVRPLLILACLALPGGPLRAAEKPNVLFLLTDDQRSDSIAALGNPVAKTPNLDALVNRGFVFRNAYCMGSTMPAVCNPSRHMILSSMSLYRYDPKKR